MVGAIILTFIITSLIGLVMFLYYEVRIKDAKNHHINNENDSLRREIQECRNNDQRRRESRAYDRGLYDGRGTDMLYRQCLQKYMSREQPDIMMNGEEGGN